MRVILANRGNPDHGDDPSRPVPGKPQDRAVEVADLAAASVACRRYISELELGGGEWAGGEIVERGRVVGHVSYNGKVWAKPGREWRPGDRPLYDPSAPTARDLAARCGFSARGDGDAGILVAGAADGSGDTIWVAARDGGADADPAAPVWQAGRRTNEGDVVDIDAAMKLDEALAVARRIRRPEPGEDRAFASLQASEDHARHRQAMRETGFWGRQGAGCLFVARSTGRLLLALRSDKVLEPGTWGTWGGAIDAVETPLDAVLREAVEEVGVTVAPDDVTPLLVFRKDGFAYHNHLVVVDEEFEPELNWETADFAWSALDDLPAPVHFGVAALLDEADSIAAIRAAATPQTAPRR